MMSDTFGELVVPGRRQMAAEALGEPPALVIIITRDIRVRENSTALGFPVE
jgi:hypothetical protein